MILLSCFLFSTAYAWVATEYWQVSVETTSGFFGGTDTSTITIPVIPTAAVTPVSTDTNDQYGFDITMIDLFLSGSNLPVTTPYGEFNPCPTSNPSCFATTTSSGTGISTETTYFALATVTQPSSCTATTFSYQSYVVVNPPSEVITALSITSTFAHLTTHNDTDYSPATLYTYTELDLFLANGQDAVTLGTEDTIMLGFCQDPRGCYLGQGQGCTATGDGLGAMTEDHGPLKTSNGAPTATGPASKKNRVGRNQPLGSEVWALGLLGMGFLAGVGLL